MKQARPYSRSIVILCLLVQQVVPLWAAESSDPFQFFQEEAQVVTASRRPQSIQESPVAVDVISSEEIKASGVSNLWDLFRFRVGMDVSDGRGPTGNRAIVSVRGIAEALPRNVLVLVDGRNVYSAVAGGVYWDQLPIGIQDISRIEIIRGPNAALYGSGAGLGVINIISKKPTGETDMEVRSSAGNRNSFKSSESVESAIHLFQFRLSHTYHQQGQWDNTMGDAANDFLHANKANFRSAWRPTDQSELELFTGGAWTTSGLPNALNAQVHFGQHFEMLKYSYRYFNHSRLEILSSRNDYASTITPIVTAPADNLRDYTYNEEILSQTDWMDGKMKSTYGMDYEISKAQSAQEFAGQPSVERSLLRGFLNQTAVINPYWTLVGAFSWETTDRGAPYPNYQMASLWSPSDNQTFRASYSVSHTVPTLRLLDLNELRTPTKLKVGNLNILPERLTSYEVGYRSSWFERHLQAESNLFYTVIEDMDSDIRLTNSPIPTDTFVNINQAIVRGVEMQLKYQFSPQNSLYANYTYESITDRIGNTGEVTKSTPPHKFNCGGMAGLGHGFSASINIGYKDSYYIENRAESADVPAYWRLDARLAFAVNSRVELYVAGQNLASSEHVEFADSLAVPRTYEGGVSMKFGSIGK